MEAESPPKLSIIKRLVRGLRAPVVQVHKAPALCRPEQNSELLHLPGELLAKILNDFSIKELRNIRLVCCLLNETTKRRVLQKIKLPGNADKVKAMAHGGNGFCETADTLLIYGTIMDPIPRRFRPSRYQDSPRDAILRKAQSKYLCRAILTLKGLNTVRWEISRNLKLNREIMSSLQQLPSLQHTYFSFNTFSPFGFERLFLGPGFNHLKSLFLMNVYQRGCEIDVITNDIRYALASSPTLEELYVGASHSGLGDIENMVGDIPGQANFSPSLTTLRLWKISLSLGPLSLQYLAKLKSLDIHNVDASDEKLWGAMASHRLKMDVVKVTIVTRALVVYLLSYQGLKEIHILQARGRRSSGPALPPDEKAKQTLLYSVIPQHRETLTAFHIEIVYSDWPDVQNGEIALSGEDIIYLRALPGFTHERPVDARLGMWCTMW